MYSDKTMKIDKALIPREKDGRYALLPEDEPKVIEDAKIMTRNEVCAKWKISRTKLFWLLNPEKYKEQLEKNKKNKTYDRVAANAAKQRNRAKKRKLLEEAHDKGNEI